MTIYIAHSFKYKSSLIINIKTNRTKHGFKTTIPLKYLRNFSRLLEMLWFNYKIEL